jgi:hypothetical protein
MITVNGSVRVLSMILYSTVKETDSQSIILRGNKEGKIESKILFQTPNIG